MYEPKKLEFKDKTFVYTYPPHLVKGCDWHDYYIKIIDRIFDDIQKKSVIELPHYPVFSAFEWMDLLFETGSYWEGALHYFRKVFLLSDRVFLEHLKKIESLNSHDMDLKTFIFLAIWNSHGQLKWLKAHLIRCESYGVSFNEAGIKEMYKIAKKNHNNDLLWLAKFIEIHLDESDLYPNPLFGGSNPLHLMYKGG